MGGLECLVLNSDLENKVLFYVCFRDLMEDVNQWDTIILHYKEYQNDKVGYGGGGVAL